MPTTTDKRTGKKDRKREQTKGRDARFGVREKISGIG